MDWTLPEIDLSAAFRPVVVRNPLLEVRWLAFLRGDAYVNPFHDLLHALSRSSTPATGAVPGHLRHVRFLPERLEIIGPDGAVVKLVYRELRELRLDYHGFFHYGPSPGGGSSFVELTAETEEKVYRLKLRIRGPEYRRLLNQLYDLRIPFREYYYGLRTFKLQQLDYAQIQQFKQEYGIPW